MSLELPAYSTKSLLRAALSEILLAIDDALTTGEIERNMASIKNPILRVLQNEATGEFADVLDDKEYLLVWSFYMDWKTFERQPEGDITHFLDHQRSELARQNLWTPPSARRTPQDQSGATAKSAEATRYTSAGTDQGAQAGCVVEMNAGKRGREEEGDGREGGEGSKRLRAELNEPKAIPKAKLKGSHAPRAPVAKARPVSAVKPPTKVNSVRSPAAPVAGPSKLPTEKLGTVGRRFEELEEDETSESSDTDESEEEETPLRKGKAKFGPPAKGRRIAEVVIERKKNSGSSKKRPAPDSNIKEVIEVPKGPPKKTIRKPPTFSGYVFVSTCERCIAQNISCQVCGTSEDPKRKGACFSCSVAKVRCARDNNDIASAGRVTQPQAALQRETHRAAPPSKKTKTHGTRVIASEPIDEEEDEDEKEERNGRKADPSAESKRASVINRPRSELAKATGRVLDPITVARDFREMIKASNQPPAATQNASNADADVPGENEAEADERNADEDAGISLADVEGNAAPQRPDGNDMGERLYDLSHETLEDIGTLVEEKCQAMVQGLMQYHAQATADLQSLLSNQIKSLEDHFTTATADLELRFNKQIKKLEDHLTIELKEFQYKIDNDSRLEEAMHHIRLATRGMPQHVSVETQTPASPYAVVSALTADVHKAEIEIQTDAAVGELKGANVEKAEIAVQTDVILADQHSPCRELINNDIVPAASAPIDGIAADVHAATTGAERPGISLSDGTANIGRAANALHTPHVEITPPTPQSSQATSGPIEKTSVMAQADAPDNCVPMAQMPARLVCDGGSAVAAPNTPTLTVQSNTGAEMTNPDGSIADCSGRADATAGTKDGGPTLLPPRRSPRAHSRSPSPSRT